MSGLSIATIKSPEFINITSVSPLISKCEVKVLYVGGNRNHSFITKEVAQEMAQTLPGTPIVGYFSENKDDFSDHGEQLVIDGDGVKFNCLTKPYGFVPTDTKVWFKEFQDTDEFGNTIEREYLMCEGYLWTKQYEEAKRVIEQGRPHSMELDEDSLKGHWSTDTNSGIEFFIINDSIFSKLCILGEDVEPCFEGSSITAPQVSSSFTLDMNEFKKSLFTMMQELKEFTFSLQEKGGKTMEQNEVITLENNTQNFVNEEDKDVQEVNAEIQDTTEENFTNSESESDSSTVEEVTEETEFANKKDDEDENKDDTTENSDEDSKDDSEGADSDQDTEDEDEDDDKKKKATKNTLETEYTELQEKYTALSEKYVELEKQNRELVEFKRSIEDKEKTELINSFYMLSEEDKKEIIENKANYTLDEIKSKLSVLYVEKNVSFEHKITNNNDDSSAVEKQPAWIYNLDEANNIELPEWLKAVEQNRTAE